MRCRSTPPPRATIRVRRSRPPSRVVPKRHREADVANRRSVPKEVPEDAPVFVISVAASLAGMHAQTLRQYDRLGLVTPGRTVGGGRRYSARDVALLREVQRLSQDEGVNLAGIKRIIELESQVDALQAKVAELAAELDHAYAELTARSVPSTALVVWQQQRRRR